MKIWAKTKEFFEGKFLVVSRDGSVPAWPHFVLGARDPCSVPALLAYADAAEKMKLDPEFVASIRELATDFLGYRYNEGEGDPDAPPHRTDDQAVIRAMRGEDVCICVRRDRRNVPKAAPAPDGDTKRELGLSSAGFRAGAEWAAGIADGMLEDCGQDCGDAATDIRTALAALPEGGDGWQDISSAPKDGTPILIWNRYSGSVIGWWETGREFRESPHFNDWSSGDECNEAGFKRIHEAEFWHDLPPGPSKGLEREKIIGRLVSDGIAPVTSDEERIAAGNQEVSLSPPLCDDAGGGT